MFQKYKAMKIKNMMMLWCAMAMGLSGCDKQREWLELKSHRAMVVPETLADFQAIMNNGTMFTRWYTNIGLVGSDHIHLDDQALGGVSEVERNAYLWNAPIWENGISNDWNLLFSVIGHATIVIEGLEKLGMETGEARNIKGQAHFHRAFCYYNLAQLFCLPYDPQAAPELLGLPLRTVSDVNRIEKRSTLEELYQFMLADAGIAADLLAGSQPNFQYPRKSAGHALLAKIYLVMGNYEQAFEAADAALTVQSELLDYNNPDLVDSSSQFRFPVMGLGNPEIMFYAEGSGSVGSVAPFAGSAGHVPNELYSLYEESDLRKSLLYQPAEGMAKYQGSYTGSRFNFCGIAANEVYLVRAEAAARLGRTQQATDDINELLKHRYVTDHFVPLVFSSADEALKHIVTERRKELPNVGNIRWEDLRRLNRDAVFRKTIRREAMGNTYELGPDDPRYALPIPDQEVQLSGIEQNPY